MLLTVATIACTSNSIISGFPHVRTHTHKHACVMCFVYTSSRLITDVRATHGARGRWEREKRAVYVLFLFFTTFYTFYFLFFSFNRKNYLSRRNTLTFVIHSDDDYVQYRRAHVSRPYVHKSTTCTINKLNENKSRRIWLFSTRARTFIANIIIIFVRVCVCALSPTKRFLISGETIVPIRFVRARATNVIFATGIL